MIEILNIACMVFVVILASMFLLFGIAMCYGIIMLLYDEWKEKKKVKKNGK